MRNEDASNQYCHIIAVSALYIVLCTGMASAESAQALARLEEAFVRSARAEYIAEASVRFPEFPEAVRTIFCRKCEEDGFVCLRAELYTENSSAPRWIFLRNREGRFAIDGRSGLAVRGGEFLRLYLLESLHNRPSRRELAYSEMAFVRSSLNGRECDKAVVRLPEELSRDEEAPLSAVTGHPGTTAFLRKMHPFVREYCIDRETGVLLGFRKFSASGKLLSARNLGQVEFEPDWSMRPGIFDTPANVVAEVDNTASFRAWLAGNVQKNRWKRHRRNAWSGNPQIWAYILALVGGVCLVGGWWLRRRQR